MAFLKDNSEIEFKAQLNSRRMTEISVEGRHVSVEDLRTNIQQDSTLWAKVCGLGRKDTSNFESTQQPEKPRILDYLDTDVPAYPTPVEFHVSSVTHATDAEPFDKILKSEQFTYLWQNTFSWWTLKIGEEEIMSAEKIYSQSEKIHRPFLHNFTTSPLFQSDESQYGNYRFTFPLTELMEQYQNQNCGGAEPVLRVFKTMFYKQEIVYAVLIHSPEDNESFSKYPLLENSEFVRYHKGEIIWHAQAIASNIKWTLSQSSDKPELKVAMEQRSSTYYVWDQVCLAFHLPFKKVLKMGRKRLIQALDSCRLHKVNFLKIKDPEDCFKTAEVKVKSLKMELVDEIEDEKIKKESDEEEEKMCE